MDLEDIKLYLLLTTSLWVVAETTSPLVVAEMTSPWVVAEISSPWVVAEMTSSCVVAEMTSPCVVPETTSPWGVEETTSPWFVAETTSTWVPTLDVLTLLLPVDSEGFELESELVGHITVFWQSPMGVYMDGQSKDVATSVEFSPA